MEKNNKGTIQVREDLYEMKQHGSLDYPVAVYRIDLNMMYLNLISTWAIVMPLSFLGAFVWKLPVPMVVLLLNSDQLFKCIPTYLYVKKDKWIKVLV